MALPEDILKEDDNDFFDYAGDILAAPFRGVEGAVQGAYNLADYLSFDVLPDYDTRFLGTSKTMAGGAVEGISQFATGFIPLFGLAGRAGALAKAGTVTKGVVAGAATDFTFFNGQEARLSNLIQQVPELQNPVTEFLAHDEDEGELEGRMKNVLEGLGLEAVAGTFISGLKAIKRGRKVKEEGGTAEQQAQVVNDTLEGGKAFADMPDFEKPKAAYQLTKEEFEEAVAQPKTSEVFYAGDVEVIRNPSDTERRKMTNEVRSEFGRDPSGDPEIRFTNDQFGNTWIWKAAEGMHSYVEPLISKKEKAAVSQTFKPDHKRAIREAMMDGTPIPKAIQDQYPEYKKYFTDLPSFKERGELQKELDLDKTRLDELLKKKEEGKATGADETRISMLENRIEGKEADLRVLGDVRTADVKDRVRVAEERELQERVEELDETLEDFDATVERVPRPFKTYEEEGMMDIIPKGADTLKNRLMKKFPIKGADPQDVADVEKFIDVMGKRLFGDVSLSVTNKIPSAGRYNFGNNLLQIRQSVIDEGGIKRTMVHELWHGLSRYLPKTDVTSLTKQFDKARRDYIRSFGVDLDDTVDPSSLLKKTIPKELEKFLKGKHTSENYRFKDVDEYFAEEMTDAFLKKLDEKDLAPNGTLKRIAQEVAIMFKDMFASLKSKLGIDQRQKIFNDFLKQRNVTKRAEAPLDFGKTFAEMPDFKKGKEDEFLSAIPEKFRGYAED